MKASHPLAVRILAMAPTDDRPEGSEDVLAVERPKVEEPRHYKVLLQNDDYTPMDFVVQILLDVFLKSHPEAVQIMLAVHETGTGLAGIYPFDIAESKVDKVMRWARREGHPLLCTMEPE